jgi:hypothetical protein
MKALRTFLIASAVALVLVPQVAPGWIRGAAIASLISLVTGNVAVYVNPSAVGTTPCGLNGGSTCQAGSDSNTCLTIAAPCQTIQNAAYIMNQTLLWGFNIGTAQIFLGNGTYHETDYFTATIGVPKKCSSASCSNVFTQLNGIEIIGNDASPSSVVVSPSNGTCNKGAWGMPGAVLNFISGTYVIHGFSANASSEATYECSVLATWSGVHVATSTGAMNLGPAAGGGIIIHQGGGGQFAATTLNLTVGNNVTSCVFNTFNGAQFLDDGATINFVDSGTLAGSGFYSAVVCGDGSGTNTFGAFDTVTGGIASGECYSMTGNTLLSGANNGVMKQQLVSGCSVGLSTVDTGANFQGFVTTQAFVSHIQYNNSPATPTISSCGSSPSFVSPSDVTDSSGTITVGSGATGCTLGFVTSWVKYPDCTVTGSNGAVVPTINGSGPYTGWTVTASLTGKLVYHCLFHL